MPIVPDELEQLVSMRTGEVSRRIFIDPVSSTTEHGQLRTYGAWAQWMSGRGWDSLGEHTTPDDVL